MSKFTPITANTTDHATLNQQHFGPHTFGLMQRPIIENAPRGPNIFVLVPTNGDKSLCDKLPASPSLGVIIAVNPTTPGHTGLFSTNHGR